MMKSWIMVALVFLAAFPGCGPRRHPDMPKVYPFRVTVQMAGKPMKDISVILVSPEAGGKWTTSGMTDENGSTDLSTMCGSSICKGAPRGDFKVLLTASAKVDDPQIDDRALRSMSDADRAKLAKTTREEYMKAYDAARVIPKEYAQVDRTPFTLTIAKGETSAVLDVPEFKKH